MTVTLFCGILYYMSEEPTYTLWHNAILIDTQPRTRESLEEFLEWAEDADGTVEIFDGERGPLVWACYLDSAPECGMTDVEADADTLASAGYGTDEDYGYYGE